MRSVGRAFRCRTKKSTAPRCESCARNRSADSKKRAWASRSCARCTLAAACWRLDGHGKRFDNVDSRLDGNDQRFVAIETRITEEAAATRRHFDVVAEGIRESFTVVIAKTTATGEKVDRLIASNAVEHAAFLDALTDHEVRITQLEGASGKSKASTS